jgi:Protein of unknown function (DUF3891)
MILRSLETPQPSSTGFVPAWPVIERLQRQPHDGCWMITQPSHAALAGDFAAKFTAAQIPQLEPELVRAIALHDAGWGVPDAQAIMQSRSVRQGCPKSFIACSAKEFVAAWEKSIDVVDASSSPAGGYMVSRHFARIAEQGAGHAAASDRQIIAGFLELEALRQKKLAAQQDRSIENLELLTDVLQFCDLLSLYVCCNARDNAEFPEYFGIQARVSIEGESYKLEPSLVEPGTTFQVAALRHPASKEISGREITIRFN